MFNRSLTSALKVEELLFGMSSFAATLGGDPCGSKLGLHAGPSGLTGSDVPDDREVSEEEGEAAEDEARDTDLSGFTGFFFSLSGEVGESPFGESVGVPL